MKQKIHFHLKDLLQLVVFLCLFTFMVRSAQNGQEQVSKLAGSGEDGKTKMLPYHVLPVYGNASLGYYYVNIFIGSPDPQPQSVIVDTGSGILAVPCSNCRECGHKNHLNPPYDPAKSLSSQVLTCQSDIHVCKDKCTFKQKTEKCKFSVHYAQGSSLQGIWVVDDIQLETVGKNQQIRTNFGCTEKETKLFYYQKANGIFGLAPRRQSNLLQKLFQQHSVHNGQKKIFSLCLAPNGGVMTVGGINQQLHPQKTKPDISIPYNDANNLYSLNGVRQISMGQMFITSIMDRIGGYGIFIDSGSTFSYLPEAKYNQVEKLLNTSCTDSKRCKIGRGEDSICYRLNLTKQQVLQQQLDKIFPSVEINIQNKRIQWPATKYMLLRSKKSHEVCMGLQPLNRYLLGANWMYDRDIVFDLTQKMVHIYDNVKCGAENAKGMGPYIEKIENNTSISYYERNNQKWTIKTDSPFFIIGLLCLILAGVLAIFLCIKSSSKQVIFVSPDQQEQRSNSKNTQNSQPQLGNSQGIQGPTEQ